MRWEALFADLEGQFAAEEVATLEADVAERAHYELGRLHLIDRLGGAVGRWLVLTVCGAGTVEGELADVGVDWALVRERSGRDSMVCASAIFAVGGLSARSAEPGARPGRGAGRRARSALRRLAQSRSAVSVTLRDASVLTGTIDTVGADFVEMAEHAADEPRRAGRVRAVRAIAVEAIAVVRSR